ncbi:MAG: response regulator [Planctomycetota bacterium]
MMQNATVYVVDDDAEVRTSLKLMVQSIGMEVKTFGSADEFLGQYSPDKPGCLIVDLRMPGMSGLELQERLRLLDPDLPIIMITAYAEVSVAVRAMKAGAIDFLEKPFNRHDLLQLIQRSVERVRGRFAQREERREFESRLSLLSTREREIMDRIVAGENVKRIAKEVGISPKTVEKHRAHLLQKMKLDGVVELVTQVLNQRQ